jgi:DNA invertase Pin-like site-specific DNA recombinase
MPTPNPTAQRGVGYGRCSDTSQEESVADQLAWIERVSRVEGISLARVFTDDGIPGDVMNRPGLLDLLAYVDSEFFAGRQFDALVVWDLDRLSRATSLRTATIHARLFDAGITRILTKDGWTDLSSATDLLLMNVRANFQDSGYVRSLSGNVLRTVLKKAKEGKRNGGRIPLGYRPSGDDSLVLGPAEEVELVRWIFTTYATKDLSTTDIARDLESRGVKTPRGAKHWRANSVRTILTNRAYLGEFVWFDRHTGKYHTIKDGDVRPADDKTAREQEQRRKGLKNLPSRKTPESRIVVPDAHPAIIDAATFDAVAARLATNSQRRGAANLTHWPLAGMMCCAHCKSPLWCVPSWNGNGNRVRRVICGRHKALGPGACPGGGSLYYEDVLRRVVTLLVEQLGSPEARGALRERIERQANRRRADLERDRAALQREADRRQAEVNTATRRLLLIPEALYSGACEEVERMKAELAGVRARLGVVQDEQRQTVGIDQDRAARALALVADLPKLLREEYEGDLRDALRALVAEVKVSFQRTCHVRSTRGKPLYVLGGVEVVLVPVFASIIRGTGTMGSHGGIHDRD